MRKKPSRKMHSVSEAVRKKKFTFKKSGHLKEKEIKDPHQQLWLGWKREGESSREGQI